MGMENNRYQGYQREGVTVEEAVCLMLKAISERELKEEEVDLMEALGRVVARDCISPVSQPPFDRSPLDGYALRAVDTKGASQIHPVRLTVLEEVDAGDAPVSTVGPGQAVRIMTGAPIPQGADCVIRQESTDYGEKVVEIYQELHAYDNYCYTGEDFHAGDCLIPAGTKIGAVELGILASMGYTKVLVIQLPRVAILTMGDELMKPGTPLAPGKIYNSNLYVLLGRCRELGICPVIESMLQDTAEKVADVLADILPEADLIITTGGVSVGKKDIMHEALDLLYARKIFWRVLVKPGSPTIFAVADDTPIVSLSGNPFGALTHMELLVRPLLAQLCSDVTFIPERKDAELMDAFAKASLLRRIVRGYYIDGKVYLPKGGHSSGVLSSMQGCNCLVDIPAGSGGMIPGQRVSILLLGRTEEVPYWRKHIK